MMKREGRWNCPDWGVGCARQKWPLVVTQCDRMVMLVGAGLCLAALASVLVGLRKAGVAAAPEIKYTKGKSFEGVYPRCPRHPSSVSRHRYSGRDH